MSQGNGDYVANGALISGGGAGEHGPINVDDFSPGCLGEILQEQSLAGPRRAIQEDAIVSSKICWYRATVDLSNHAVYPPIDQLDLLVETSNAVVVQIYLFEVRRRDEGR